MQRTLPATPSVCRAVAVVLALCAVGVVARWFSLSAWQEYVNALPRQEKITRLAITIAVLVLTAALVTWAAAAYLWRVGVKVRRSRSFPPPGTRVCRETAVIVGTRACVRGIIMQVLGAALALGGATALALGLSAVLVVVSYAP